jgi:transposase
VIEMSQSSWLVAGIVPGIERHPVKKLEPDEAALLRLLHRWQAEAERSGRKISRIAVAPCSSQGQAFEAGRDGVWLAPHGSSPWAEGSRLRGCDVEAQVIHPNSIAVSREPRRAKTDRLDTGLLKRSFLGGLRGERDHCNMVAIPTLEEEDAKRPGRERDALVSERTRIINRFKSTLAWLGIRGFKPHLRHAAARLETLRTPEGMPLPANTMAELGREIVRLRLIVEQIREIEAGRVGWSSSRGPAPTRWSAPWRKFAASASRPQTCLPTRRSRGRCAISGRWRGEPVLGPARGRTRGAV